MSKKSLLNDGQVQILQSQLIAFKGSNPKGSRADFYTGLRAHNPGFKNFTDKQLDNQIIAKRRVTNEKMWPKFS